ncbi:hypothetical protein tb265_20010 [Gemmatimonadetes bacterium T265]|nr:hypothetical protein tb265_20010 [Gemmatimonadetes bacterium T265]
MSAVPSAVATAAASAAPADAISAYHALLEGTAGAQLAADTQGALETALARRGLIFGTRPLCTVVRPRFFTPAQHAALGRRIAGLMRAFNAAHRAALANPGVRAQFRLEEWEEALLTTGPRAAVSSPTARLDAFIVDTAGDGGSFALTEVNGETPAGAGFNDTLTETFLELPAMRAFVRRWHVLPVFAHYGIVEAVLGAWRRWADAASRPTRGVAPRVAILDWDDVPTRLEFLMFQSFFQAAGCDCVIADPRAATFDANAGALVLGGAPIDVIYKRVLLTELVERAGVECDVLRAWQAGAVCMVNPPDGKILHKKASLAVLSDERNAGLFDAAARAAIADGIPWTRVVEERRTVHDGREVDLVPYLTANRERFVLKPNDEYGGTGIVLGWTVDAGEWEQAVARALAEPYVVQERVPIPFEAYPSVVDGEVHLLDRLIDTAPYVTDGVVMEGLLSRLSTAALLNVTAGGGSQVPNFVVVPR